MAVSNGLASEHTSDIIGTVLGIGILKSVVEVNLTRVGLILYSYIRFFQLFLKSCTISCK